MYPLRLNNMHFQFALDRADGNESANSWIHDNSVL